LILRKYIKHSLLWIIINVLSGVIGIVIILKIQNIFVSKYQIFGYFAVLIVFGILTGVSLIKLTRDGSTLVAPK
jgi:intracellular septation protein A